MERGFFNAKIKKSGETVTLRKEPEDSLFREFFSDYQGRRFYEACDFERVNKFELIDIRLSSGETVRFNDFCNRHSHKGCDHDIISAGKHSLLITMTGIGTVKEAVCNVCFEHEDITDYDKF